MISTGDTSKPVRLAGRHKPAIVLFVVVCIGFLIADLTTKYFAFAHVAGEPVLIDQLEHPGAIPPHDAVIVVPHILSLKLTLNTGAVFGMGKGGRWVFVAISVVAVFIITRLFMLSSAQAWWQHMPLALILSGALGNMVDRFLYSAVRDMCWLFPGVKLPFGWEWFWMKGSPGASELYPWIFNVADIALVIGVIWLLPMFLFAGKGEENK